LLSPQSLCGTPPYLLAQNKEAQDDKDREAPRVAVHRDRAGGRTDGDAAGDAVGERERRQVPGGREGGAQPDGWQAHPREPQRDDALYSLSAERRGRFICTTSFCLSLWKPLVIPRGVKPTGVKGLATVKRPDGKRQVAFRGAPLYRFVQDMKPGDVKGNGFRDVGVWRPVVASRSVAQAPAPAPSQSNYGY
jgi:Secreted repeat of unknown function